MLLGVTAVILQGFPAVAAPQSDAAPGAEVAREVAAMGTRARLRVRAVDRRAALSASEAAVLAIAAAEQRLSTWRADSELAALNRATVGVGHVLSPELARELGIVQVWQAATAGAFDPAIGALIVAYDLRGDGCWPTPDALQRATANSGWRQLELSDRQLVRHADVRIEEGAFGKGAALDLAGAAALAAGARQLLFDFGGQLLRRGEGSEWVALAHPTDREQPVCELLLRTGSVSTSGNSEHGRLVDGRFLPHLFDPRTGAPAADFGSVAVVADSALDADCLSTGLFVLGPDRALAFAATRAELAVVVLEAAAGGRVQARASERLRGRLRAVGDTVVDFVGGVPAERGQR